MQEMLIRTSLLKSMGPGKASRALITDGRVFPAGLPVSLYWPRFAGSGWGGGTIALIEDGDIIAIDIPNRSSIQLQLKSEAEMPHAARRRSSWRQSPDAPKNRQRQVRFCTLRAYASSSGDQRR